MEEEEEEGEDEEDEEKEEEESIESRLLKPRWDYLRITELV